MREPVTLTALVVAFVISIVDLLQLLSIIDLTVEQLVGVHLAVTNGAVLGGAFITRRKVTPVASPVGADGNPLESVPGFLND